MNRDSKIRVLFFTPFAGYTGSEVMLFNMLKSLDANKFEICVFSMYKGELLNTLPHHIKSYYSKAVEGTWEKIGNRVIKAFKGNTLLERQLMQIHREFKPDLWYLNTMVLNEVMSIAHKHKIKYAVHFHELQSQYGYISGDEMQKMVTGASFTVGCCNDVCNNLKILGASNVHKQYECIETGSIRVDHQSVHDIRKELKIPEDHLVITMSGQRTERKGIDLFINLAKVLQDKPYFFLWLGAAQNTGYELFLEKFIAYNKLTNIKLLHPPRKDYYNYLDVSDIFFLSSREDPFPLVMLEAAYLGKYIVSLDSGGAKEFLSQDMGHIIRSLNISEIASELSDCCQKQIGAAKNTNGKERALEFDVSRQVKLFEQILINECRR